MTRRPLILALAVLLALAAGWTGFWVWSAGQLETAVARFADQQRARGLTISYEGPAVSGFPVGLSAGFDAPLVAAPQGWRWAGPAVSGRARVWSPFTIETDFPGLHRITFKPEPQAPDVEIEAEAEEASAWARLRSDGQVDQGAIAIGQLVVRSPLVGPSAAERLVGRYGPSRPGETAAGPELDLAFEGAGLILPEKIETPLGRQIESAIIEATLVGEIPPGKPKQALARWRESGGKLEVMRLSTVWGPLQLEAEGTASLDAQFRPIGAFQTRIRGLAETLDALARAGIIESGAVFAAQLALAALGGDGENGLQVPITLQEGRVFLGPVPIARLSPVL